MASLLLKGIYKVYPSGVTAVTDFNLEIKDKEFIVFVGPSGCGKSTTLRMIAQRFFILCLYYNRKARKLQARARIFSAHTARPRHRLGKINRLFRIICHYCPLRFF